MASLEVQYSTHRLTCGSLISGSNGSYVVIPRCSPPPPALSGTDLARGGPKAVHHHFGIHAVATVPCVCRTAPSGHPRGTGLRNHAATAGTSSIALTVLGPVLPNTPLNRFFKATRCARRGPGPPAAPLTATRPSSICVESQSLLVDETTDGGCLLRAFQTMEHVGQRCQGGVEVIGECLR